MPALDAAERAARASGDVRLYQVHRVRALALRLRGESARVLAEADRALELAPPEARGSLLRDRGILLLDLGRLPESEVALREALELLPEGPDRVHAEATFAVQRMMQDAFDDDLERRLRRCLDAADRGLLSDRVANGVRANYGAWLLNTGRFEEVEVVTSAAIGSLRAAGALRRLAMALLTRGGARLRLDRAGEGLADTEEAIELLRREGYLRMLAWGLCNLACFRMAEGDDEDALQVLDEAEEVAIAVADRKAEHTVASYRAVALSRVGRLAEADERLGRARAVLDTIGSRGDAIFRAAAACVDARRPDDPAAGERVAAVLSDPPPGSGAAFLLDLLRAGRSPGR